MITLLRVLIELTVELTVLTVLTLNCDYGGHEYGCPQKHQENDFSGRKTSGREEEGTAACVL